MLLGEFRCKTDGEGRLLLPGAFRTELAGGVTVTRGIERCVAIYPAREWEKLAGELQRRLPLTSRPARRFTRFMFSEAAACAVGGDGGLWLPGPLRRYAGIDEEVVVIGLLSHLEVWHPGNWERNKVSFVDEGPALAEDLREFGI